MNIIPTAEAARQSRVDLADFIKNLCELSSVSLTYLPHSYSDAKITFSLLGNSSKLFQILNNCGFVVDNQGNYSRKGKGSIIIKKELLYLNVSIIEGLDFYPIVTSKYSNHWLQDSLGIPETEIFLSSYKKISIVGFQGTVKKYLHKNFEKITDTCWFHPKYKFFVNILYDYLYIYISGSPYQ